MVRSDNWLPFAALILSTLSVVLASPIHQDTSLEDLQRREVLDRAIGPAPPVTFGDDHPPPIPPNADDKETPLGDGSDLYRSKKENPDDPPTDDPADYPLKQSDRATEYNHDPEDEGPPEIVDPKKPVVLKKGTALRDITVHVLVKGKMKCQLIPAAPAAVITVAGLRVPGADLKFVLQQGCVPNWHGQ